MLTFTTLTREYKRMVIATFATDPDANGSATGARTTSQPWLVQCRRRSEDLKSADTVQLTSTTSTACRLMLCG